MGSGFLKASLALNKPYICLQQKQIWLPEKAAEHFDWFASFAALDYPASSKITREGLHWKPAQPTFSDDLEKGNYFK